MWEVRPAGYLYDQPVQSNVAVVEVDPVWVEDTPQLKVAPAAHVVFEPVMLNPVETHPCMRPLAAASQLTDALPMR